MLLELNISNFALIDTLQISFSEGLNIITGETGAGKSIILSALNLLCGSRYDSLSARNSDEAVWVEALFQVDLQSPFRQKLEDCGLDEDETECLIRREVSKSGRSRCSINRKLLRLSDLKLLAPLLVNIHSQHETQQLLNPKSHFTFFSAFAGDGFMKEVDVYQALYRKYLDLERKRSLAQERGFQIEREKSRLEAELSEISCIEPRVDEEEALNSRHKVLVNQSDIRESLGRIQSVLDASKEGTLSYQVATTSQELGSLAELDNGIHSLVERFSTLTMLLDEFKDELASYASDQSLVEPEALETVEERMGQIEKLKRKYGGALQEVLAYEKSASDQLFQLMKEESELGELEERQAELKTSLVNQSRKLTRCKAQTAATLKTEVNITLGRLSMAGACFEVKLIPPPSGLRLQFEGKEIALGEDGAESVEFYLASHVSKQAMPLTKIASGGEISRIMLALKNCFAHIHPVQTFIFDEIETGIGGETAHRLAEVLEQVAAQRQSIVITHLPQIALKAKAHFLVEKITQANSVLTQVRKLKSDEGSKEISRMMGIQSEDPDNAQLVADLLQG
jgi:DNA repair protein RecN (Recombination protein N)